MATYISSQALRESLE